MPHSFYLPPLMATGATFTFDGTLGRKPFSSMVYVDSAVKHGNFMDGGDKENYPPEADDAPAEKHHFISDNGFGLDESENMDAFFCNDVTLAQYTGLIGGILDGTGILGKAVASYVSKLYPVTFMQKAESKLTETAAAAIDPDALVKQVIQLMTETYEEVVQRVHSNIDCTVSGCTGKRELGMPRCLLRGVLYA